jgi:hypothetical protein
MVTSNAAEISNWQEFVGQIQVGMYADLVVLDTFHENPYRNLIEAIDRDVRLTIVQGKAVFGDVDLMSELQGDDWEYINGSGFSKAIDVTSVSVEDGSQTWESIESGLAMAMRNEISDIRENWGLVSDLNTDQEVQDYLDEKYDGDYNDGLSHLKNLTLDPVFTMNDDRYFDVINRSSHANFHVDMSKLYDYYDVTYDGESNRPFIEDSEYDSNSGSDGVVCTQDLCWDGSSRDPVDCSCPTNPDEPEPEPEPEPETSTNFKVLPGNYNVEGGFDGQENLTCNSVANQLIITIDGVETRYTIDTSDNQYASEDGNILRLQTYDDSSKVYTGVDWNGKNFTLTKIQSDSQDGDNSLNVESDSQLVSVGILAMLMVIFLSLMAIQSMRKPE